MNVYVTRKIQAQKLRREGKTYSEILQQVPVAKSTLSLWLREVGLSKPQAQRITEKRTLAQQKGGATRTAQRLQVEAAIQCSARKEVQELTARELWLMGTVLYWAEGSKQKPWSVSTGIDFANSDSFVIKLFLKWLTDSVGVQREAVKFGIYIHESSRYRIDSVKAHWSKETGFPKSAFCYVYYKKHNIKTVRKNTGQSYFGTMRVSVRASTNLNRKVAGWIQGINQHYWGKYTI